MLLKPDYSIASQFYVVFVLLVWFVEKWQLDIPSKLRCFGYFDYVGILREVGGGGRQLNQLLSG